MSASIAPGDDEGKQPGPPSEQPGPSSEQPVGFRPDVMDEPAPGAPAVEVARYLFEEIELRGLITEADFKFLPMWPTSAKAYCTSHGHVWNPVSRELRRLRAARADRSDVVWVTAPAVSANEGATGGGGHEIAVWESVVRELRETRWLPRCPVPLSGFRPSRNFKPFTTTRPCGSWFCSKCGLGKLDQLLGVVEARIVDLPVVYTAVAPYEHLRLLDRVRQRVHDHGAEVFWYRTIDDDVCFVSTHRLRGRQPPAEWTERTPADAMQWLRSDVMVLPNHWSHGWSDRWTPEAHEELDSKSGEDCTWLGLDADDAQKVHVALSVVVKEQLDIDLSYGVLLPEDARKIKALLDEVVTDLRRNHHLG